MKAFLCWKIRYRLFAHFWQKSSNPRLQLTRQIELAVLLKGNGHRDDWNSHNTRTVKLGLLGGKGRRRGPMTTLIIIGVVYAALSVSLSIILVIGGWRANGSPQ